MYQSSGNEILYFLEHLDGVYFNRNIKEEDDMDAALNSCSHDYGRYDIAIFHVDNLENSLRS